jgi:hypothetical protein
MPVPCSGHYMFLSKSQYLVTDAKCCVFVTPERPCDRQRMLCLLMFDFIWKGTCCVWESACCVWESAFGSKV